MREAGKRQPRPNLSRSDFGYEERGRTAAKAKKPKRADEEGEEAALPAGSDAGPRQPMRGEKDARNLTVDFSKLDMATLKRYKRHYRLKTRQNVTKTELALAVAKRDSAGARKPHWTRVPMPKSPALAESHPAPSPQTSRRRPSMRPIPSRSSCTLRVRAACSMIDVTTSMGDDLACSSSPECSHHTMHASLPSKSTQAHAHPFLRCLAANANLDSD